MKLELESVYLILSKDKKLIAKGVPRNRYICHIDEKTKKRILTYSSKGMAESGFKNNGFYLSDVAEEYIRKMYPEVIHETGCLSWINNNGLELLFEAVEFKMTLTEVIV